ncbi:MAG TPA: 4-hydroxy-tetrahydrodipicolinate reductase [Caulobacteraceae bacterium]|nr:4-hydroxy-tetrahydrodipicolinate reductase [Caulobacteraceae bacterium]
MTAPLKIGVGGALGRMGRAVTALARERPGLVLAGRFDRADAVDESGESPPLSILADVLAASEVVVDFSTAAASAVLARAAAARRGPALVIGATGLGSAEEQAIAEAAGAVPIVWSGNYSVGVNVLAGLVEQAARRLPPDVWDIEVLEIHHRRKVDAPSGTARLLALAAARGRGRDLAEIALAPRDGDTGPRAQGAIGFASLRGGGVVGEHSVIFAAEEETLTLSHGARDRALFARGALEAAVWVVGRPPGLYDMIDVLGFRD